MRRGVPCARPSGLPAMRLQRAAPVCRPAPRLAPRSIAPRRGYAESGTLGDPYGAWLIETPLDMPIGGIPHPEFIDLQQWIDKYLKEIKLNYNEKRAALACSIYPSRS